MDINLLLSDLKTGIVGLIKDNFNVESDAIKKEVVDHVDQSKTKLERWSNLLKTNAITKEDFLWLLESQKNLLTLSTLHTIGISKIRLGHFKNKVINFIAEKVSKFIL